MKEEIKLYKETYLPDGTRIQTTRRRLIAEIQHTDEGYISYQPEESSTVYENLVTTRKGGSERYKCESLEHAMDHHEFLADRKDGLSGSFLANDHPTRLDLIDTEDD